MLFLQLTLRRVSAAIAVIATVGVGGGASVQAQQPCATTVLHHYRTGFGCPNGVETCQFSMAYDAYAPSASVRRLLMSTGYDVNVYQIASADVAPTTTQPLAFAFAANGFAAISQALLSVDVDPVSGWGIAPYNEAYPSRVFQVDATGTLSRKLRLRTDGAVPDTDYGGMNSETGPYGMRSGLVFSMPGVGNARYVYVAHNQSTLPNQPSKGTMKIRRVVDGPPMNLLDIADLGVYLQTAVAMRGQNATTIVGAKYSRTGQFVSAYAVEITPGSAGALTISPGVSFQPGVAGNTEFSNLAVDPDRPIVYLLSRGVPDVGRPAIEAWNFVNPTNPQFLGAYVISTRQVEGPKVLSAGGNWVLAQGASNDVIAVSFVDPVNPQAVIMPATFPMPTVPDDRLVPNPPFGGKLFTDAQGRWAYASAHEMWGTWSKLNPDCLSTTPTAAMRFDRAAGTLAPSATNCGTYPAANSYTFPGDALTLVDTSTNTQANTASVAITGPNGYALTLPLNTNRSAPWTPPADRWGAYSLTMTVTGNDNLPYTKQFTVYVCGQPQLAVATSPAVPFAGNTQFTVVPDGAPTTSTFAWTLTQGAGQPTPVPACNGQMNCPITLPIGNSTVVVSATYPHKTVTGASYVASKTLAYTNLDWMTFAGVKAEQPAGTVPTTYRKDQDIVFKLDGSGPAGTQYSWSFTPTYSGCLASTASTCTVPAGTFAAGTVSATLTATLSPNPSKSNSPPLQITVTDPPLAGVTLTVIASGANPDGSFNIGVPVNFKATQVGDWTGAQLQWDFGASGCGGASQFKTVDASCGGLTGYCQETFSYSTASTRTVTVKLVQGGNTLGQASKSVTIANAGTCTVTPTCPTSVSLSSPVNGATGQVSPVSLTWSAVSGATYEVFVDGTSQGTTGFTSTQVTVGSGQHTWRVTASKTGCTTVTSSTWSFTVGSAGGVTITPSAASAKIGDEITFSINAGALAPTTVRVDFGTAGCGGAQQVQTTTECGLTGRCSLKFRYPAANTYQVQATAFGADGTPLGSGSTSVTISNSGSCDTCGATAVPTISAVNWSPGTVLPGGQPQPYVGQTVTLSVTASNTPTEYVWIDFGDGSAAQTTTQPTVTHVWNDAGVKNVRVKARNCRGDSAEVPAQVTVSPDNRPVTASFGWIPVTPSTDQAVTFSADVGDANGNPNRFTWDFGDGTVLADQTTNTATHTFSCGMPYTVKLTARRVKNGSDVSSTPAARTVTVSGKACAPDALLLVDVARNLKGSGDSVWNTEVRVFNPLESSMQIKVALEQPRAAARAEGRSFELLGREELELPTILQLSGLTLDNAKASIWLWRTDPQGVQLPVISARTYTGLAAPYDDFGQFVAVEPVTAPPDKARTFWLMGAQHSGSVKQAAKQGFRTNLTIVNPAKDAWGDYAVTLTLLTDNKDYATVTKVLPPYPGYWYEQVKLSELFGIPNDADLGKIIIRVDVAAGNQVAISATLVNNGTNAPIYIPAQAAQ